MGRPKIKIIDDSQPVEEKTLSRAKSREKKPSKVGREAKLESIKASDEVEHTQELMTEEDSGAKQISSEHTGDASDALRPSEPTTQKKPQKPGKTKKVRSKKYQEVSQALDKSKFYPLSEAVDMAKKLNYAKFDGTLEAHINTATAGLRGLVSLPYASGKTLRILAFGKGAEASGATLVGSDELIEEINQGKVNFDLVVTTPEWMPKLAKVARILGPRGLMPNPKNGTITEDLKKAVESFQAGKTEYKTEVKAPVIHLGMGKVSQPTEELSANIKTLIQTLGKTRVKKVTLSPTMGPAVKVDLASI